MAKNRFAQPLYGKIIYIYETDLKMEELSTIFSPKTYWIDVTGIDCEVGYIQEFRDGKGVVWVAPPNEEYTFEDLKANKIELFKSLRNAEEIAPIEWNGHLFDYDSDSRDRLAIKRQNIEDNGGAGTITWTLADNSFAIIGLDDFIGINNAASERSEALHLKYNVLKAKVEACSFEDELNAIVW